MPWLPWTATAHVFTGKDPWTGAAVMLGWTALAGIFAQELGADEAAAASVAWNKLLLVQLSVFMLAYVPPRPIL